MSATLIHGDALSVLATMPPRSVDMIYVDPPFGNRKLWAGKAGSFDDRWQSSAETAAAWDALEAHSASGAALCRALCRSDHDRGYLGFVAGLLLGARRVLRLTGSVWIHFDDTMGAQIRIIGSVVFGLGSELANVIWRRTAAHSNQGRSFARVHDTIAVFIRSRAARWRLWRASGEIGFGDPLEPATLGSSFLEDRLAATAKERIGYPTQKPVALLRRLITSATLPGDVVLDPTCGSGTTLVAAIEVGRRAVGIDASADAITTARSRLPAEPISAPPSAPTQLDLFGGRTNAASALFEVFARG